MSEFTGEKLKREILDRIEYQGKKLDGSVEFLNSFDGDILSMVYRLLNEPDTLTQRITELEEEREKLGDAVAHMGAIFDSGKGTDAEKIEEVIAHFQELAITTNSKGES